MSGPHPTILDFPPLRVVQIPHKLHPMLERYIAHYLLSTMWMTYKQFKFHQSDLSQIYWRHVSKRLSPLSRLHYNIRLPFYSRIIQVQSPECTGLCQRNSILELIDEMLLKINRSVHKRHEQHQNMEKTSRIDTFLQYINYRIRSAVGQK